MVANDLMISDFLIVHAFFELFELLGWFSFIVSIHTYMFIQCEYIYIHSIYIIQYIYIYAVWLYRCIYSWMGVCYHSSMITVWDDVVDRHLHHPQVGFMALGMPKRKLECNMIPKRLAPGVVYFWFSVNFWGLRIYIFIYIYIYTHTYL